MSRLQQLASSNKLSSEDISGGTITLSNIGAIGGKFGSPLLNLPEVAIIAIGRIQKLPRFADDGNVYPAFITNVSHHLLFESFIHASGHTHTHSHLYNHVRVKLLHMLMLLRYACNIFT